MTQAADLLDRPPGSEGSRREQGKAARRARITAAACALLRETGLEELSMKALAARADVSLSTVYNLFESKSDVLTRVFDEDLVEYERRVRAAPARDALDRMFAALDVAADLYAADPDFYRAVLWRRRGGEGDEGLQTALREPRIRFWRELAELARDEGWLHPDTDARVLGTLLIQLFAGVVADWIGGDISLDTFRAEVKLGFASALGAFATAPASERLSTLVKQLHARLSAAMTT